MEIQTFRARSLQEALQQVRASLGPEASVLHTREIGRRWLRWVGAPPWIEVTASAEVRVPSRLGPVALDDAPGARDSETLETPGNVASAASRNPDDLQGQLANLQSLVADLCEQKEREEHHELPESLFRLFTDLIDAEVSEDLARELIARVRTGAAGDQEDPVLLKARIARLIEEEIEVSGPIRPVTGERRLVALVGPTGVGKTTTIAKLAANYHLRERKRVGLITVDTYRIAAVEQLRTYADIIDLPMEVVSTPREMREAVTRLNGLDLILMDTAGRSPHDEVKVQELKSMLQEASADEVHLVLSSVSSLQNMKKTAMQFAQIGATSLILTKLDEATGLGNLIPLLRSCHLPLSYLTNGQNVPDDIEAADQRRLARIVLGMEDQR